MKPTDPKDPKSAVRLAFALLLCGILTAPIPLIIYCVRDYPPMDYLIRLIHLDMTFREGAELAPIFIWPALVLIGAAFLLWLGVVFCYLPVLMIRLDGTTTRAGRRLSSVRVGIAALAALAGLPGVIFAIISAFAIGEQAGKHSSVAEAEAEFPKFKDAISAAVGCNVESLRPRLFYPPNSLVIYSARKNGPPLEYSGFGRYYYACPSEWLAAKKEDVKLVVYISFGSLEEIGHYSESGRSAYRGNWKVEFVDLESRHIVARTTVSASDPKTSPNIDVPFAGDSRSWPGAPEVESAIRETVIFGSAQK